ncbi:hypothetical protein ACOME3_000727 [Neoechinorhynchus agilis]
MSLTDDRRRCIATSGLMDKESRPLKWKLFLKYLPANCPDQWPQILESKKQEYLRILDNAIENQNSDKNDHPLSLSLNKKTTNVNSNIEKFSSNHEMHWEVVERILFVFYRLDRSHSYSQGMNELVAPIYYTFAKDSQMDKDQLEVDVFFCFLNLMSMVKDNFVRPSPNVINQTDEKTLSGIPKNRGTPIDRQVAQLDGIIKFLCSPIYYRLKHIKVETEYFAFRWLTLLFAHEFPLEELLLIWDVIFSHEHPRDIVPFIATAMVVSVRDRIMINDFGSVLTLLQKYPNPIGTRNLLRNAQDMEMAFNEK